MQRSLRKQILMALLQWGIINLIQSGGGGVVVHGRVDVTACQMKRLRVEGNDYNKLSKNINMYLQIVWFCVCVCVCLYAKICVMSEINGDRICHVLNKNFYNQNLFMTPQVELLISKIINFFSVLDENSMGHTRQNRY